MDVESLLTEFVTIESVNRSADPTSEGEAAMADAFASTLRNLGASVTSHEVQAGRPNVLGVFEGSPGAPTLLWAAHLDTVPLPPQGIAVRREDNRLYGRGSCDCKAGMVAMLAAVERLQADPQRPTIVVAGTVDEEVTMLGAAALLADLPPIDAAVLAEPTDLVPIRTHNGVVRVELVARGVAAHSSMAYLGINAISAAARALVALDARHGAGLAAHPHPVTGAGLMTATLAHGGTGPNVVPDSCRIVVDRRITPSESAATVLHDMQSIVAEHAAATGDDVAIEPMFVLSSMETAVDARIVRASTDAVHTATGAVVEAAGAPYATDACRIKGEGGIDTVVLGPGSIAQAHTIDEWVDLTTLNPAIDTYVALARSYA